MGDERLLGEVGVALALQHSGGDAGMAAHLQDEREAPMASQSAAPTVE